MPPHHPLRDVLIVDGIKLKRVAKRLLACRGAAGKLSGGKLLVAWRPREGLILGMAAHRDGEVSEARLVPDVLQQLQPHRCGPRLFVADRQYCKARAGTSRPQQAKSRRSGAHTSVHRLQEKHKQQRQARANT